MRLSGLSKYLAPESEQLTKRKSFTVSLITGFTNEDDPEEWAAQNPKLTGSATFTICGRKLPPEDPPQRDTYTGDISCDDRVDVSDAVMLARYLNQDKGVSPSEAGLFRADTDLNGTVTTDDLTMLLQIIARQI